MIEQLGLIYLLRQRPDRLWGPPLLLSNRKQDYSGRGVKLTLTFTECRD
jgi:hypothetical protein